MYTKQEASRIRQSFWTAFGQYMLPVLSAEGLKINWINYKTGIKHIQFTMEVNNKSAIIAIVINHKDAGERKNYYEKFLQQQKLLENSLQEKWQWDASAQDENGKPMSRIFTELKEVNIFNQSDWPAIISFLKPRIVALDEFWSSAKYSFEL